MNDKMFNEIGIQIPEGYKPYRFILEGRILRIFLEREKNEWQIQEIEQRVSACPECKNLVGHAKGCSERY